MPLKKDSSNNLSTNSTTAFSSPASAFFALGTFTFILGFAIGGFCVWATPGFFASWVASTTALNLNACSRLDGFATYSSTLHPVILLIFPANVDLVGSNKAIFKILPFKSNGSISFSIINSFGNFLTASFFIFCSERTILRRA